VTASTGAGHVPGRDFLLGDGLRFTLLTTAEETDGRMDLLDGWKDPGAMSPLHLHERYEERLWVAAGELEAWAGDTHRVLRSGDYLCVPAGVVHTIRAGPDGCRALTISSPAGFAEFVARTGTPAGVVAGAEALDVELLNRIANELGDVMLGPPGTLPADLTAEAVDEAVAAAHRRVADMRDG
jgi:mannose-6-phosphate isomerase-like protein (cupin superfamily)